MNFLPGPGYSVSSEATLGAITFVHLGPIGPDLLLERLEIAATLTGAKQITVAPVLTASPDLNTAALTGGAALVGVGSVALEGKPALLLFSGVGEFVRFAIPLGVPVRSGAKFVLIGFFSTANGIGTRVVASLFTIRLKPLGKGDLVG